MASLALLCSLRLPRGYMRDENAYHSVKRSIFIQPSTPRLPLNVFELFSSFKSFIFNFLSSFFLSSFFPAYTSPIVSLSVKLLLSYATKHRIDDCSAIIKSIVQYQNILMYSKLYSVPFRFIYYVPVHSTSHRKAC